MFGTTSSSPSAPLWRHDVHDQEENLVRELMEASDVDAVLARMENDHFRHLSPILRKLTSYEAAAPAPQHPSTGAVPTSPGAGAPPPPPPPPPEPSVSRTFGGGFDGSVDWDAQSSPSILQSAYSYTPRACLAASPVSNSHHIGLRDDDSTTQASPTARPPPPPPPPPLQTSSSPMYGAVAHDPLDAYRRPADGATAAASRLDHRETESRYQPTIDSWLWPDAKVRASRAARDEERPLPSSPTGPSTTSQHVHVDPALDLNAAENGVRPPPAPSAGRLNSTAGAQLPRMTTRMASVSRRHFSESRLAAATGDLSGLENASQSRIARQLQLLRNYRQLAELCSCTDSPSIDLFRALPSEELARIQVEQLKCLAQRDKSPIAVNNNYFFDNGSVIDGKRLRGDSSDPLETGHLKPNTGTAPGNSRPASEALTAESHVQTAANRRPSGTSGLQRQRPPLLPSPRTVPLQSPQPSSGPDSPVVTPPLSLRSRNLAPPSPSRSQRGRSHCNRLLDVHYTPTATTEEAGSSYGEDEEEADYAGDCMGNSDGEDEDYDVNGTGYRRPPPRIIEREQHRRFPTANIGDDAFPSSTAGGTAQPPLVPTTSQLMHERQNSYSGDYANNQSLTNINEHPHNTNGSALRGMRSGSATCAPGGPRSSMGGVPGSDGGRRSVSSAINVLAGEQELRNNAQWQSGGGRGDLEHPRPSQHPAATLPLSHQQQRRSLSTVSSSVAQLGGGALTDPGASPKCLPLHNLQQGGGEREGSTQGSPTSASRGGGHTERRMRTTPTLEKRSTGESGTRGESASVAQCDRRRKERDGTDGTSHSRRKDETRRRWGRRGADSGDGSNTNGSDVGSVRSGTCGSNSDDSACDTPGNPQLQTHSPRSSVQWKGQTSRRRSGCDSRFSEEVRTQRRKDRFDPKHSSAKTHARQKQQSRRVEGDRSGGGGARRYNKDSEAMSSVRSAASYSCSHTTSSDISDYMPGSYYSPIRSGHRRGSPRGTRGGMGSPGRPGRAGRGGRGGTLQALYGGRGRDGAMSGPHYGSAPAAVAAGAGGSHGRRPVVAGGGMPGGVHGPHRRGGGLSPQLVTSPQPHPQRGGVRPPTGLVTRGPNAAKANGSPGLERGMIRLPDGRVIPVTSPEARRYQQAMRMMVAGGPGADTRAPMTMQQRMGYNPIANVYQSALPYAAGPGGMPSAFTPSPIKSGRVSSPSIAPSAAMTTRSHQGAGSSAPHIQPGLLYGSLLPKARPKTALVVEENEYGRSHSADPRGNASRALLLERGSVCPVQAATTSSIQPWHLGINDTPQVDVFPIIGGAINGSTNAGVLPLEWKSGGSGCVVGRSGHVPVAPRDKLSSHYVPPGSQRGFKQSQHVQQQPRRAAAIAASSPAALLVHLPNDAPAAAAAAAAASFTQKPQGYHSLRPADAGQRNSTLFHSSSIGGANAQQRYLPLQEPLKGAMRGQREPVLQQQQNPHSSINRAAVARNANLQRFGIAALQG